MKRSLLIAAVIAIGAAGWLFSADLMGDKQAAQPQKPPAEVVAPDALTAVRVAQLEAQPHASEVVLRGVTEARRNVDLKVETGGRIAEILVAEGQRVEAGTLLLRLAENERAARVAEAEALVEQRQIEYDAAVRLNKSGYRSETDLAAARAALHAAQAALETARIELENVSLLAPFGGTVERHLLEEGAYADRGDAVIRLVELDPLLIVAYANEQEVLYLAQGTEGTARLADGRTLSGTISFVASAGETATRSFRVEMAVANGEGRLPAGLTADVIVSLSPEPAYKISPAALVLSEDGRLGVKAVDAEDRVVFHPVTILDDEIDGIWLGGLPPSLRLIVVGQELVEIGERVRPTVVGEATALAPGDSAS